MSDAKTKAKEAAIVQQALDRFKLAIEAEKAQRTRELDDLKFQVPELQWPDEVKTQRAPQMVNGVAIPGRPMLAIPKLDQPVQLVLNQEKAAHLGVQVHALTEDADDDTAEILQGLYRRIETDSRASLARSWAFERAVKAGRGAYRVLTEYDPAALKGTHDQRIVIKRLLYQDAAYLDPFATEP
ncbi:MAG TPA: portal protein, partial [Gemmatimonadales bacterium]|nr:portal protein [Gemmatimonadales bacterium]